MISSTTIIETHRLGRRFGETRAVESLTLRVTAGEVFGFLGHNGAGKTTTIRLLNGVLDPSTGSADVLGLSPASDGPALRRRTGVLTETPSLDERLTGWDNLAIYADLFAVPQDQVKARVSSLLDTFELADRALERVSGYSKGMKQRLALARALIHQPEILFLDEPTAGLDPVAIRQVHQLITRLSREEGRTIFLCTHNLAEAQQLCDRVGVMEHGRLIAIGTPAELAAQLGAAQRLELETEPEALPRALEIIAAQPGLQPEAAGPGLLTISGAVRQRVPALLAALVNSDIPVYRVTPHESSLADVYFALHQ